MARNSRKPISRTHRPNKPNKPHRHYKPHKPHNSLLHTIALTFIPGITPSMQLELLRHYNSAEDIIMRPEETLADLNINYRFRCIDAITSYRQQALVHAASELEFCRKHSIQVIPYNSEDYPHRLKDCSDAPAIIYYRGTANLNAPHIIAVVGTRKITEYGKQVCVRLTERIAELLPDTLVISGLAYGVDIHMHRGCLDNGLSTIGVVAHGMDQIYPAVHRKDAKRMLSQGGILTEYPRGTSPLQGNFLRRNRIVAGLADATIVVESASHGGSLVTARIALSYERMVFAVPGRINDPYSVGCNNLILKQKALIALSADDFIHELGWWSETTEAQRHPLQLELFGNGQSAPQRPALLPQMNPQQQCIAEALQGSDGMNPAALSAKTGMSIAEVSAHLFDMEMEGIVKILPGGFYMLKK